jgi:hypothetical protein
MNYDEFNSLVERSRRQEHAEYMIIKELLEEFFEYIGGKEIEEQNTSMLDMLTTLVQYYRQGNEAGIKSLLKTMSKGVIEKILNMNEACCPRLLCEVAQLGGCKMYRKIHYGRPREGFRLTPLYVGGARARSAYLYAQGANGKASRGLPWLGELLG